MAQLLCLMFIGLFKIMARDLESISRPPFPEFSGSLCKYTMEVTCKTAETEDDSNNNLSYVLKKFNKHAIKQLYSAISLII